MATSATIAPKGVTERQGFTAQELYELQKYHGKPAPVQISYQQRNSLKAKFKSEYRLTHAVRRSLFSSFYAAAQDFWTILRALLVVPWSDCFSWLRYRLFGYEERVDDIVSGRSRFRTLRQTPERTPDETLKLTLTRR